MLDNIAVKNRVYGLIELDVTKAREHMRSHKSRTGETLSFTGWILKCIGQAVSEDKQMQAVCSGDILHFSLRLSPLEKNTTILGCDQERGIQEHASALPTHFRPI